MEAKSVENGGLSWFIPLFTAGWWFGTFFICPSYMFFFPSH
jgi:hypothetical protein